MAKREAIDSTTIGKVDLMRLAVKECSIKLSYDEMAAAFEAITKATEDSLMNGNTVILGGIGRLVPVIKPAGEARNPGTGKMVKVPDRLMLTFSVNSNFKLAMREVDTKSLGDSGSGKSGDKERSSASSRTANERPGRARAQEQTPAARPSRRR